jgi:hypothetical protein
VVYEAKREEVIEREPEGTATKRKRTTKRKGS